MESALSHASNWICGICNIPLVWKYLLGNQKTAKVVAVARLSTFLVLENLTIILEVLKAKFSLDLHMGQIWSFRSN